MNGIYRHYKGDFFLALGIVTNASNEGTYRTMVRYRYLTKRDPERDADVEYVRDEVEFREPIEWPDGVMRPRFVRAEALLRGQCLDCGRAPVAGFGVRPHAYECAKCAAAAAKRQERKRRG